MPRALYCLLGGIPIFLSQVLDLLQRFSEVPFQSVERLTPPPWDGIIAMKTRFFEDCCRLVREEGVTDAG